MVEDNRDPFEFDDDPLAGAEDLEIPSFDAELDPLDTYRDSTQAFAPPTAPPGVPEIPTQDSGFGSPAVPPSTSPPPGVGSTFPPPTAGTAFPGPGANPSDAPPAGSFPPPAAQPPAAQPPSSFPPPGGQPPATSFPPAGNPPGSFAPPQATPPASANFADFPPPAGSSAEPPSGFPPAGQPPGAQPPPGGPAPGYGAPPAYSQGYAPGGVAPPIKKKGKGCLFWGIIISVIFALLIGGCIAAGVIIGQSASDSANSFLDAVEDGDYDGAADQSNPACGLNADQIERDLGGMTGHFIIAIGPIASGEVEFGSRSESIAMELRDDLVCSYEILEQ